MLEAPTPTELRQQWNLCKARLKSCHPSPEARQALAKQLITIGDRLDDRGVSNA